MRARSALAVAACVASASVAFAVPANAGLTTFCEGEAGAVTVPGDLRVASTKSCVLNGTVVTGTVTVEPAANLVITGGSFQGAVSVGDDAFFDAQGTELKSTLTVTDGYGFFMQNTKSGAVRVTVNQHPDRGTYAYLKGATVDGDLSSAVGEVYAENSNLNGNVSGTGVAYVDLVGSVVARDLTVSGAALGSVFCAGEVYGNASYTGNSGTLQIGGNGPVTACEQASFFNGNVTISDNTANVNVSNNIVRGNLAGTGNDPAPAGENNRVRGTVSGQFLNMAPAAAARSMGAAARTDSGVDNRRAEARAEANAAGPADL